jgi:hypothetical protein
MKKIVIFCLLLVSNLNVIGQFTFSNIRLDDGCIPYPTFGVNTFLENGDMFSQGRAYNSTTTPLPGCIYPQIFPNTPYIGFPISKADSNDVPYFYKMNGNSVPEGSMGNAVALPNNQYLIVGNAGTSYVHDGFFSSLDSFDYPFVTKVDSNLNPIWMKGLNAKHSWISNPMDLYSLVMDVSKQYFYVSGVMIDTTPSFPTSLGYNDIIVLKYDLYGNEIWRKQIGGSYDDEANLLANPNGGFFLIGTTASHDHDMADNVFPLPSTAITTLNCFVMSLDSGGNKIWLKKFGGTSLDYLHYMQYDTAENCIITGGRTYSNDMDFATNKGDKDFFIAKLNLSGQLLWCKAYGGSKQDDENSICINPNTGNYIVTGTTGSKDGDFNDKLIPQPTTTNFMDGYILEVNKLDGSIYRKQRIESNSPINSCSGIFTKPNKKIVFGVGINGNGNTYFPNPGGYWVELDAYPLNTTNINKENADWIVYPNPTSDKFWIESNNYTQDAVYTITNQLGQEIKSGNSKAKTEIDISNFKTGIYFLKITQSNKVTQQFKILKQ